MNILMINPTHPNTPHISAVRAWRFAQELAAFGHHVVLLTATRADGAPPTAVDLTHDWHEPCVLACANATQRAQPGGVKLPRVLRRARTAMRMLRSGGESSNWVRAAVAVATQLPQDIAPDVIWATFGRMEAVVAARRIAAVSRRPWVLDIKDNWELYVPHGLRRLMAWRIRGFASVTANARITQRLTHKWLGANAMLIYSGVDDRFYANPDDAPPTTFEINVVGGIYFPDALRLLIAGIGSWYRTLPESECQRIRLRYIGSQTSLVRATADAMLPGLTIELPGYVATTDMARLCRRAAVNAYVVHPGTFHHKLPELLACGRPVLACPSESDESIDIAAPAIGQLLVTATPGDIARALTTLSDRFFGRRPSADRFTDAHLAEFRWPAQARQLERVLIAATSVRPATPRQ